MTSLSAQTPDGKTLHIDVPEGTDPAAYPHMVDDAMSHYVSTLPTPPQQGGIMNAVGSTLGNMATAGTGGIANMSADTINPKPQKAPIPSPEDLPKEKGLEDVSVPDALTAASLLEGGAGLAGKAADVGADAADTIGQYAGRMGENQMGKLHGTSLPQFRQLGRDNFGDVMRASYEAGDASPTLGPLGREQAINERLNQIGSDIGDIRGQAGEAGSNTAPNDMAAQIQKNLGPDYGPGGKNFEQQNALEKQIQNIQQMPQGGPESFAQRASELHQNAAGTKMVLPNASAENDVANQMSHINDEAIKSALPQDISDQYDALKEQYGLTAPLNPMELRGQAKEALGKGSNTVFGTVKDLVSAPKIGANVGFGTESAMRGISGMASKVGDIGETISKAAPYTSVGAMTSNIMSKIQSDPRSLGQFAKPLIQAAQTGGSQGLAAMHYILSTTHPAYNEMMMNQSGQSGDE